MKKTFKNTCLGLFSMEILQGLTIQLALISIFFGVTEITYNHC